MTEKAVETLTDEIEDAPAPRSYRVDGMRYDLTPRRRGMTTTAYAVSCDGGAELPMNDVVVVQHHGASAATRWVVLTAAKPFRVECDTVAEMAAAVAKHVHG